ACHQSKLRRARPQATSKAEDSAEVSWVLAREDIFICPNGLPITDGVPIFSVIFSAAPGMAAQPPHTMIWSSCVYSLVEDRKNCSERLTVCAMSSVKGSRISTL